MAQYLFGSATWDAASVADGNMEAKDITVTGAVLGDYVEISFPLDLTDSQVTGSVTAADTVTAVISNSGSTATNFASCTVKARVTSLSGLKQ